MAFIQNIMIAALATSLMAGCTAMKRATGQIDSTTLPGQREDILPPDQQQARDPAITGQALPPQSGQMASAPGGALQPQSAISTSALPTTSTGRSAASGGKGQESIVDNGGRAGADCDPKIDLCPQQLKPEPLPPPSPLLPDKPAKADKTKGKVAAMTDAKTALKKSTKKILKKKKPLVDRVPPEPKDDAPPPPGPSAPKPQGQ